MNYYIWWLNQPNTIAAIKELNVLPKYLKEQLESRRGRPGRGRLWVDSSFPEMGVDPWPDTELGHELAGRRGPEKDAGGIVFKEEDLELVLRLPGIVTDFKLDRITDTDFLLLGFGSEVICAHTNVVGGICKSCGTSLVGHA